MRDDVQQQNRRIVGSGAPTLVSETTDPHLGSVETAAQLAVGLLYIIRSS